MNTENISNKTNDNSVINTIMSSSLFRYFVRKNYPTVEITNEELDELCIGFNQYLKDLNLTDEAKSKIIPKNEMEVILNSNHPLKQNGFHSALLLHFNQFITKMQAVAAS
jgi:hypothetical protein